MSVFSSLALGISAVVLVMAMIYGAVSDLGRFTIPNWVPLLAVAAFFVAAWAAGLDVQQIAVSLGIGLSCLTVGVAAFALGVFGGGDIKLFSAGAIWAGWSAFAPYVMAVTVAGGILSLILLLFRHLPLGSRLARVDWVGALHRPTEPVPYGVAIATGTVVSLPRSPVMAVLIGG